MAGATRLRALVATVVALVLAVPLVTVAAQASGAAASLVVRASHTSSGRLVITSPITLPWYDAETPPVPAGVVKTSGSFAGFAIYRGQRLVYGFVQDKDIGSPVTWGESDTTLRRGTYSVVVLTQRSVVFSMPLTKAAHGYTLTASKPAKAQRIYLNANTGSLSQMGSASFPLHLTDDMAVMAAYTVNAEPSIANKSDLCLSHKSGSCAKGDIVQGASDFVDVGPGSRYYGMTLFFYPHTAYSVPAGSYYMVGDETDVGVDERARLVTYIFG